MTPAHRLLAVVGSAAFAGAQNFAELSIVRNPPQPYQRLLQFQAGLLGALADEEVPAAGLEDEFALDGHVYYHDEGVGGPEGGLDAYAGRDGLLASLRDGNLVGGENVSRLELSARLWPFWREGYYKGDDFVPVGQYEGHDWEAYLGFGREAAPGLYIEAGPFYHDYSFSPSRNSDPATYTIPDDYAAYGLRLYLEQNSIQYDRRLGRPLSGYVATIVGEREWNDSTGAFGSTTFTTELPSAVWRARARLEWYFPQSDGVTWSVLARGRLTDQKDRVYNYQAQEPPGHQWIDAMLRLRFDIGDSFELQPFVQGQYLRLDDDTGSLDAKFFAGGGAEAWLHFSDSLSATAWYSFLDNESRPSVSVTEDRHGQHMFFVGLVLRFGTNRR